MASTAPCELAWTLARCWLVGRTRQAAVCRQIPPIAPVRRAVCCWSNIGPTSTGADPGEWQRGPCLRCLDDFQSALRGSQWNLSDEKCVNGLVDLSKVELWSMRQSAMWTRSQDEIQSAPAPRKKSLSGWSLSQQELPLPPPPPKPAAHSDRLDSPLSVHGLGVVWFVTQDV